MFYRWIFPILLLASTQVQASTFKTEIIEYIDDVKVVAFISESDIGKSPRWDPMQQEIPLTITDVITVTRKQAAGEKQADGPLSILEIELKEIPKHPGYWHYLVKTAHGENGKSHPDFYIVLMNGQVIPAMQEPETIK